MTAWRDQREFLRRRPLLADGLLAVAVVVGEMLLWLASPRQFWPADWLVAQVWAVAGGCGIALRRRWPWWAVVLVAAHTAAITAFGVVNENLAIVIVTYTVAAYLPVRQAAAATVLVWLPALVVATGMERYRSQLLDLGFWAFVAFNLMLAAVCFLGGRIVFTRRRYVAALVERARTAEQNQQTLTAHAVVDERRRIARELHDMVAHHVSVMGVLATGSRRLLRKDPDTAEEALATIEETSRTALREMRRLLDVLRSDPEPADPMAPQPGLAGLAGLVDQVREAGLSVTLHTAGGAELEPGVALTVYRIVQEALTNVLKHGGAEATAEVRLEFELGSLTVEVYDTGRGPLVASGLGSAHGIGHGLLGMRERVALFGGTLRTGPRPGGGFRVYARIPIEEGRRHG